LGIANTSAWWQIVMGVAIIVFGILFLNAAKHEILIFNRPEIAWSLDRGSLLGLTRHSEIHP